MAATSNQKVEDAFGAARSYLHAIRMAAQALKNPRDMCAFDLLAEAAEAEIQTAQEIFDDLREDAQ